MMKALSEQARVVLLVDHKVRDLMTGVLVAHHLGELGIRCDLEPLEAWQGVLGAHRPDMIIFNHVNAPHLVKYTKRLAQIGVQTAILPNEGILYDPEALAFVAGKYHNDAHIDLFFCWNEAHRQALIQCGLDKDARIEVIGVPRFDFYFKPWSKMFSEARKVGSDKKPRVLFCTNFGFAHFLDLPKERADKFFECYEGNIPSYRDYWNLIKINHRARENTIPFLTALAISGKFELLMRPHPREPLALYQKWLRSLPEEAQKNVTIDNESNITRLILGCDLEISCETCTTALESWIAGKPTVEITLERHPVFFHPKIGALNVLCDNPANIVALVERELADPQQARLKSGRMEHLKTWCHSPDGLSSAKMAQAIADHLKKSKKPDWSKLKFSDQRRSVKLKALKTAGLPYHFDPLLPAKAKLLKGRYTLKSMAYKKSVTPQDVRQARQRLERSLKPTA